ncbi:MarR family transcriptional regulator [Arthrobacter ginkgonis]|uniref:MarR family transcriptional regulator n=1 Tax=Arthrobacter ginkgonis TaxID=1630594 RepID=A0ABP7D5Q0_9MICC
MSSSTGDDDDLLLERQFCFALAAASRTVISAYKPVLQEMNLTHPQYLVMLALWEKSPRSVKEIGEMLMLAPATLSPLLKRLEGAGYITRRREKVDERTLVVGLTPAGTALRTRALGVPETMLQKLSLTREQAAQLRDDMVRLTNIVQAGGPVPPNVGEAPDAG